MAADNSVHAMEQQQVELVIEQEVAVVTIAEPLPMKRFFVEGLAVLTMAVGLEVFCRVHGPFKRGFYCDDQSIRMPYKPNSVGVLELILYGLVVNFCATFLVEGYRLQKPNLCDEIYSRYEHNRTRVGRLIVRSTMYFGYSVVIILVVWTLTTATKYPVGRLRPHFIDICKPDIGYTSCNTTEYITNYTCTSGYFPLVIQEARLSFFSGHSAISVASAVFFCIYLQDRLAGQTQNRVIVPILQTLNISFAMYIAYTRISDNWHHYTDVAVGCFVGLLVSALLCKYYVGLSPKIVRSMESERLHLLPKSTASQACTTCKRSYGNTAPIILTPTI
ncbi:hypothetical protein M3Y97_00444600 [Aphelenchoides bicaudatus]|nr:hypothetical protein M3Y97_00444600 [Aphelenchoides bicaudatus]